MYLSCLLIDVGNNPDRPRPGRLWLRNRYRVHQRLCMAFPSKSQQEKDPEFLLPYEPCGFPDPRPERCSVDIRPGPSLRACAVSAVERAIHVPRDNEHNFLFRIDPQSGGRAVIVVHSAANPKWEYAFHNARHLLRCYEVRQFSPELSRGRVFRFRLDANPTMRLRKESRNAKGENVDERWVGKRVGVPSDKLEHWLTRRTERCGFRLCEMTNLQPGYVYVTRSAERGKGERFRSVRYDGVLELTDADAFRETLIRGIGPGKAFGFGLLSVAPVGAVR